LPAAPKLALTGESLRKQETPRHDPPIRQKWVNHRAGRLPLDKSASGGAVDNPALSSVSRQRDRLT